MSDEFSEGRERRDTAALQAAITAGVVAGIKQITADEQFVKSFWKQGFEELATHSGNGASQWVGKRLLTILITSIAGVCIVWLVKTGAIK
jgi:hypothetical protein